MRTHPKLGKDEERHTIALLCKHTQNYFSCRLKLVKDSDQIFSCAFTHRLMATCRGRKLPCFDTFSVPAPTMPMNLDKVLSEF